MSLFLSQLKIKINIVGHMAVNFVYTTTGSINVFVGLPFFRSSIDSL